jgi:hypothetical protein
VDGSVGDVPGSSSNCAQEFRLESLENFSVWRASGFVKCSKLYKLNGWLFVRVICGRER